MPKQENECPDCGYDFDEEGDLWICRHCGLEISKRERRVNYYETIRKKEPFIFR